MTRKKNDETVAHTVVGPDGTTETHTETPAEHAECLARLHAPQEEAGAVTDGPSPESAEV